MAIRSGVLLTALLFSVATTGVAQKKTVKQARILPTSPASGKEMYMQYCAVCHGQDAKGAGPAVSALKVPPPDLTTLAKRNGGKYPYDHVSSVLRFGTEKPAHGSVEMPIWGPLFQSLDKYHDAEVRHRITNLNSYLASLQTK